MLLGSFSKSVKGLIKNKHNYWKFSDFYIHNNFYNGGTCLVDIAVIIPVLVNFNTYKYIFYMASREH